MGTHFGVNSLANLQRVFPTGQQEVLKQRFFLNFNDSGQILSWDCEVDGAREW